MKLYVNFEWGAKHSAGWAQLTREDNDGCSPHCLTEWRGMTRKQAQELARDNGAEFRDQGRATP